MLGIGYAVYWFELYVVKLPDGHASGLAWGLWALLCIFTVGNSRHAIREGWCWGVREFKRQSFPLKFLLSVGLLSCAAIFAVGFRASLFPPHLPQEFDALNYHITVPRQHLIVGNFKLLPWSSADIQLLPLDYGLAPFWLATFLPNKIPQFFFAAGLIFVVAALVKRWSKNNLLRMMAAFFAVGGSHGLMIQTGTAMTDLISVYLFFAALHSLSMGSIAFAAVEFCFFFWSRAFMPMTISAVILGVLLMIWLGRKIFLFTSPQGCFNRDDVRETVFSKKFILTFILFSCLIAGPFLGKSLYYSGTPLFPFFPGMVKVPAMKDPAFNAAVLGSSKIYLSVKDNYGQGRGPLSFLEHFWILAVPEKGVNNRFDYPVGLPYLLCLAPFLFLVGESIRKKKLSVTILFILVYWGAWWFGTQQARFLYVPMILMMMTVISEERFLNRPLLIGLVVAVLFTAQSVWGAHKADFFRRPEEVMRPQDRQLIEMSKTVNRSQPVELGFLDVAFADFPVTVTLPSAFVFQTKAPATE